MDFEDKDLAVQATNDDASECKSSAIRLGYYHDEFLPKFVPNLSRRHQPIINRGYFVRVYHFRKIVETFLNLFQSNVQVVNLGCGFDTLFFHFQSYGDEGLSGFQKRVSWFEADFEKVLLKKMRIVLQDSQMSSLIGIQHNSDQAKTARRAVQTGSFKSENYSIVAADLRSSENLISKLLEIGLNPEIPTLFLTECVLVYMDPSSSSSLISNCLKSINAPSILASYDPIHGNDRFGDVMISNMSRRGCSLPGMSAVRTLDEYKALMVNNGASESVGVTQLQCWNAIPVEEQKRVSRIEFLDEIEEWSLMLSHYVIVLGMRNVDESVRIEYEKAFHL